MTSNIDLLPNLRILIVWIGVIDVKSKYTFIIVHCSVSDEEFAITAIDSTTMPIFAILSCSQNTRRKDGDVTCSVASYDTVSDTALGSVFKEQSTALFPEVDTTH